jgi:hypothetical protein
MTEDVPIPPDTDDETLRTVISAQKRIVRAYELAIMGHRHAVQHPSGTRSLTADDDLWAVLDDDWAILEDEDG